jgi:hypothetical protein
MATEIATDAKAMAAMNQATGTRLLLVGSSRDFTRVCNTAREDGA